MLLLLSAIAGEVWLTIALARWITPRNPEYLGFFLGLIVLSVAGYQLVRWRFRRLPLAMMGGQPGPAAVGVFGAMLLVFPGYATGLLGALLQVPPVQKLFGAAAGSLVRKLARQLAGRMGAGGMPGGFPGGMPGGFPGGFPGAPPGMRPGGAGMRPDSRARGGKVIDTTGERIDDTGRKR